MDEEKLSLEDSELASKNEAFLDEFSCDHCLRHITSIQVRNLSPFPARDTLTTALSQKPIVSLVDAGLASDDTDIMLARKRSRRISSASISTLKSLHSDHGHESPNNKDVTPTPSRIRARTTSKSSAHGVAVGTARKHVHTVSTGNTPAARRLRPRTISQNSALDASFHSTSSFGGDLSTSSSGTSWLSDSFTSQKELEKIIWARLVETFLTIETPTANSHTASHSPASPPPATTQTHRKAVPPSGSLSRRAALNNSGSRDLGRARAASPSPSARQKHQTSSTSSVTSFSSSTTRTRTSSPSPSTSNSTAITSPPSSASPRKLTFPHSPPPTPPPSLNDPPPPVFISPICRPSTNPNFALDPQDHTYPPWADLTVDKISINLWGHVGTEWGAADSKGKTKESVPPDSPGSGNDEWKIISTWDLNFSELVPLPDDNAWTLPANTLVLTMSPENRPYYLPSSLVGVSPVPSRSHSPDYNSDSELAVYKPRKQVSAAAKLSIRRGRQRWSKREVKSASWNDLVKLVSLQASLADAQNLLDQAVHTCDDLIAEDKSTLLRREASQWGYRLQILQEQRDVLDDDITAVRDSIEARREQLRQRQMRLAEAKAFHEGDLLTEVDVGVKCADERKRVAALKSQIEPIRTSLLSTLAYIFPIELLFPPDLLFTILDVPLPIPMGETDPAPPLSLQSFPEVNEDSVATALGYAALVVHLMATYLCRTLVYPITYIGSRSLIKDPISAMMGPRMFPLYSKGVDTYRFEYAVFLLNKDIELLMAERDLRAEDFRNTLPNLKNLLLTLTSSESALPRFRPLPSPSISSGLRSPSTTPKLTSTQLPSELGSGVSEDGNCASEGPSATATPQGTMGSSLSTASSAGGPSRRPRSYLSFNVPLTSMFRVRYPSSSGKPSVKSVDETPDTFEEAARADVEAGSGVDSAANAGVTDASDAQADEDEEDRRTIRGRTTPVSEVGPNDKIGNGHFRGGSESEKEKSSGEEDIGQPNVRPVESVLST